MPRAAKTSAAKTASGKKTARRRPGDAAAGTRKKAASTTHRTPTLTAVAGSVRELHEAIALLRTEVRSLRESLPTPGTEVPREASKASGVARQGQLFSSEASASVEALQGLTEQLRQISQSLAESLAETPKAADFEPLAEHLYEFAQLAPRLLESLEEIPKVIGPVEGAARALQETSETLQFTHDKFSESLLKLPRAEDYEPLAAPLREFASVSPELARSLSDVLKVATPLAGAARDLSQLAGSLKATQSRLTDLVRLSAGKAASTAPPPELGRTLREIAAGMHATESRIEAALESLPRDPDYARFAAQLKELATVSPSLMDWLKQVPAVTKPLADSIQGLSEAAARLREGRDQLRAAIEAADAGPSPRPGRDPDGRLT